MRSAGRQRLFSTVDRAAFWACFVCVEAVYFFTLAPSVTLEDSGELITAAAHLGVPHPPGYPVWTLVNWLFVQLVPFGNVAWRANLCSSLAGALACGLIGLIASRLTASVLASTWIRRGLPDALSRPAISLIAGLLAGTSLGFSESLWYQSVITEVYALNLLVFAATLLALLRSALEPDRLLWPALAFFLFGVSLTIHQSLVLFAPALLLHVALTDRGTLRSLLSWIIVAGSTVGLTSGNRFAIAVSLSLYAALALLVWREPARRGWSGALRWLGLLMPGAAGYLAFECLNEFAAFSGGAEWLSWELALPLLAAALVVQAALSLLVEGSTGRRAMSLVAAGAAGIGGYAYLPLAAWTNPPMNWAYTGTLAGFIHSVTRGGYDPIREARTLEQLARQFGFALNNLTGNYTVAGTALALFGLAGLGLLRDGWRRFAWVLLCGYVGLSLCLTYLLNTTFEEHTLFIARVFYSTSYGIVSIWVGLGAAVLLAVIGRVRGIAPWLAALGLTIALAAAASWSGSAWSAQALLLVAFVGLGCLVWCAFQLPGLRRFSVVGLLLVPLAILAWNAWPAGDRPWSSSQRGHDFGWRFGHDMLVDLEPGAVLFAGTDAGRFVATYMVFVESFEPPERRYREGRGFDRRDLYVLTQNYLWDPTYLASLRDQYGAGRPAAYGPLGRWLGRETIYPETRLDLPGPARHEALREQALDELSRAAPSGVYVPHAEGVDRTFAINATVARAIFEANRHRHAFYVEESIPLPWMSPHLEPHGLIMKLHPQPLAVLPDESVQADMAYWSATTARLLADARFRRDIVARRAFSKLRASIGILYRQRGLAREAEIAERQAIDLFGGSPEANSTLIGIYLGQGRIAEARAVARNWLAHDPEHPLAALLMARIEGASP